MLRQDTPFYEIGAQVAQIDFKLHVDCINNRAPASNSLALIF